MPHSHIADKAIKCATHKRIVHFMSEPRLAKHTDGSYCSSAKFESVVRDPTLTRSQAYELYNSWQTEGLESIDPVQELERILACTRKMYEETDGAPTTSAALDLMDEILKNTSQHKAENA